MKISICNKIYDINCIKEEEDKIKALAKRFDLKARQLGQTLGLDNEMIILLCALKLEADIDELKELNKEKVLTSLSENMDEIKEKIKNLKDKVEAI